MPGRPAPEEVAGAGLALVAASAMIMRRRQLLWGATELEAASVLPGDDLLPDADLVATRGIGIRATRGQVWPWIAQIGQGRGGFYSYDVLENMIGCRIHSADHIVSEWQNPQVGEEVKLHPDMPLNVVLAQPGDALVLRGAVPPGGTRGAAPYDFTWAFVLREVANGNVRLLVRERYLYTRRWAPALVEPVSIISFLMTRRMLKGIKERVESGSGPPIPGPNGPGLGARTISP